ncbi:MAG TPA: response regulator [Pyrinomonadaceae bacterium]|jgi:DNA-binding response OmpR family regulator|nr:response regulator [Pyrinomonadaceae bacterium]
MPPVAPRILIVDDDSDSSELIEMMLQYSNTRYDITSVRTPEEGLRLAATQRFDLFVLDYRLLGMNGADVCRTIRRMDTETPVMFFTGAAFEHERREAMQAGANAYLVKPDDLKKLLETVRDLLSRSKPASARDAPQAAYQSRASA